MKHSGLACSLVLPGLLDFSPAEARAVYSQTSGLTELETAFARAEQRAFGRAGLEATLFALFHVDVESHQDLPVAAASYLADTGAPAAGWCLRADPVHLIPDRDQLILAVGPESLDLSMAETTQLVNELNSFFAEDAWHIEAPGPQRWYLHVPTAPALRTYGLARVRGRAIGEFLPLGSEGKHWQRIMNEIQMLLHSSSVNIQRQAAGKLTISSLWFWGGGVLPAKPAQEATWCGLWSDEVVSRGLARFSATPGYSLPQNAAAWLGSEPVAGEHLLVLDTLQQQWLTNGEPGWQQALQLVQRDWFAPLLQAVRNGSLDRLDVYTTAGNCFSLTRRDMKRWWKRRRSMSQFCN